MSDQGNSGEPGASGQQWQAPPPPQPPQQWTPPPPPADDDSEPAASEPAASEPAQDPRATTFLGPQPGQQGRTAGPAELRPARVQPADLRSAVQLRAAEPAELRAAARLRAAA